MKIIRRACAASALAVAASMVQSAAQADGTFTVTNTRNGFAKTYAPKAATN